MDKEQWIEIFKEINDRVPTEEEIQAGVQSGEIIVSDLSAISKVKDSESNATPQVQPHVELNDTFHKMFRKYKMIIMLYFVIHVVQRILEIVNNVVVVGNI